MKWASLILNVLLLIIIILLRECSPPCPSCNNTTDTIVNTIIKIDTIQGENIIIKPSPDTIIQNDSIPYYVNVYIDTNKTIRDYFAIKKYNILMRDDSVAQLILHASITKNAIDSVSLDQKIYTKTKIIKEPLRNKFYLGIAPGISLKDTTVMISGVAVLNTKKDHLYFIKAEPLRQQYEIGLMWKIKFK
jgi:hypothetical protein